MSTPVVPFLSYSWNGFQCVDHSPTRSVAWVCPRSRRTRRQTTRRDGVLLLRPPGKCVTGPFDTTPPWGGGVKVVTSPLVKGETRHPTTRRHPWVPGSSRRRRNEPGSGILLRNSGRSGGRTKGRQKGVRERRFRQGRNYWVGDERVPSSDGVYWGRRSPGPPFTTSVTVLR